MSVSSLTLHRDGPLYDKQPPAINATEKAGQSSVSDDVAHWVREHWGSVYGLLYRLTRNPHDAEDMAQETFLRGVGKQNAFKAGTNRRAWLLRIATNLFLDQCRRKKALKIGPLEGAAEQQSAGDGYEPSGGLESSELNQLVLQAIAALSETSRAVFLLRIEQELEFSEIASIIGTSEATARWHLMQARRQMMAWLEGKL